MTLTATDTCDVQSRSTRAVGAWSATLTVTSNGADTSSALTGQGFAPEATLSPASATLGAQRTDTGPSAAATFTLSSAAGTTVQSAGIAGKDITIRYTLNGAARMTFTLQRRTSPAAAPRRGRCPVRTPGGPGPQPVSFGDLGVSRLDAAAGENFATVNRTGTVTKAATAARKKKRKPVALTRRDKRGRHTLTLRGLVAGQDLSPGWYRVLLQGVRADGSTSQAVAVKFWVLAP